MSFRFKRFNIDDSHCAQKVGTDGVLIGAWADVEGVETVLDIGAGSGLVSLMIAQRTEKRKSLITAVEIDDEASKDCIRNFAMSPWAESLKLINEDFSKIVGKFDLIISNPPFFCGDLAAKGEARMLARQGETLNYFSLIRFASSHLTTSGRLAFTSDMRHRSDIIFNAELCGLSLRRLCQVSGKENQLPIRLLWEFSREKILNPQTTSMAHRSEDGSYHKDYVNLTKDFYLKL